MAQAIAFGAKSAAQGHTAWLDIFLVGHVKELGAVVLMRTAFERLAAHALRQSIEQQPLDPAYIDSVRRDSVFKTQYALDIRSPHKLLNVDRFYSGGRVKINVIEHEHYGWNRYRQVVAFPYRDVDYSKGEFSSSSSPDSDSSEQYEISAKRLLSNEVVYVINDLRHYH